MRFISKNANLRIILKPGMPASPLTGALAIPTVFVKFQDGEAYVENEDLVTLMRSHMGFNTDFIAVDEGTKDPFAYTRSDTEPAHHITEMKYGHPEKRMSTPQKVKLSPEMEAYVNAKAMEMVKEMLPGAINAALTNAKASLEADKAVDQAREESKAARNLEYEAEAAEFPVYTGSELTEAPITKPKATRGKKSKI